MVDYLATPIPTNPQADPKKVIRAVAAFIGADAGLSEEDVAALVEETSFEVR